MRDVIFRSRATFIDLWRRDRYGRWAKRAAVIVSVFVVITGIILITGNGDDTQAAPRLTQVMDASRDEQSLPFDFQFVGQGQITGGSGETWLIGGVPIEVAGDHTQLIDDIHPDDFVNLSGRILQNRVWLADRIELTQEGESFFIFNGPLDWANENIWRIGGHALFITPHTMLGRNLSASDVLLATFTVIKHGVWEALEIRAFDKFPAEPTPTPSPVPTSTPTRSPEGVEVPVPQSNPGSAPAGDSGPVTICHHPPGKPDKGETKTVGGSALQEHLNHGDTLEPCP